MRVIIISCCLFVFFSCHTKSSFEAPLLFELMNNTGIDFTNTIQNEKDQNIFSFRNFYNGGGVAIGDINNDGLADVFFTANQGSNKLFLNKGNWHFEDISQKAGFGNKEQWSTGVVMVDINHDGWLDIYISNSAQMDGKISRANQLYINNKNLGFTEAAAAYGLANEGYTTQASFFDYDLDGDLDCFMVNNSPIPVNTLNYANKRNLPAAQWPIANFLKGGGDHLFRNEHGKFVEITQQAGIHGSLISLGLGVLVGDVNGDHYPDIYVSNDFFERDYLYINQGNGSFKDELEQWMQHTSLASMGADMADINNDGFPDIFTTDMLADDDYRLKTTSSFDHIDVYKLKEKSGFYHQFQQNTLQINNQHGKFLDAAYYSGVKASDWSWGGLIFDADNDGLSDLFVCNGINNDLTNQDFIDFFANDIIQKMAMTGKKEELESIIQKMPSVPIPNKAFKNLGNLQFADQGTQWGLAKASFSNGAAYGDLDNDGDLDLVVNNVNQPAFVYKNNSRETTHHNYIGFSLQGNGKNVFSIGSQVKVYQGNQILSREIVPSRGFQSSVDYKLIIGLGSAKLVDSIEIFWPDRTRQLILQPAINKVHIIQQNKNANPVGIEKLKISKGFFQQMNTSFKTHTEDDFIDFYQERNIPEMISHEGPKAAVADVNGDGLDDIYITGTTANQGQLYLQASNGNFKPKSILGFQQFLDFEETAAVFFDADKDGDMDLFLGAGGNNTQIGERVFQHRLFINDGRGNFTINISAFPANKMNIAVAVPNDMDGDGDMDLFVGGRSVPGVYGMTPQSYLYMNDGFGNFIDIAADQSQDLSQVGMVTGAVWIDIDHDKKKELVVVGEYICPRVFKITGQRIYEIPSGLNNLFGWWRSVATADIDNDGDMDLVLGNIGENFYLHPDKINPVKIFTGDFDQNNIIDKILTRSLNGKDLPVFLKKDLEEQIPLLKKQNLKHELFAKKSIQELFSEDIIKRIKVNVFNHVQSGIALNNGKGMFKFEPFPMMQQLSSINTILLSDFNGDGLMDMLMGGNQFGFQPQFGRLDASLGHYLQNTGMGKFISYSNLQSGVEWRGETRDIQMVKQKQNQSVLVLQNNLSPILYHYNSRKK